VRLYGNALTTPALTSTILSSLESGRFGAKTMLAAARLPPLVCLSAHDPPAAAPPQRRLRAAGCTRYTHSAKATADVARARRRTCCCALPLDSLLNSLTPLQQDLAAAAVAAIGARVCVKTCDRLAQDGVLDRVRPPSAPTKLQRYWTRSSPRCKCPGAVHVSHAWSCLPRHSQKLTRKLVHIICGPGFLLTWLLFRRAAGCPGRGFLGMTRSYPARSNSTEARYIAALVPLANGVRLFCIGTGLVSNEAAVKAISREGDKSELLRGPLYYVVVMVFATIAFWRASPVGIVAISLMCGGDGAWLHSDGERLLA